MMAQAQLRGGKQAGGETTWGRASELTMEQMENIILEMSNPDMGRSAFMLKINDFVAVMDELVRRCAAQGANRDEYLLSHAGNMGNGIEEIFNHHSVDDFNSMEQMDKIRNARDTLLGVFQPGHMVVSGQPGAAEPELVLPEVPTPVEVGITGGQDYSVQFNEEWLGLFETTDAQNLNANLAAESAFYSLIGDTASAAHFGQRWLQDIVDNVNNWRRANGMAGADMTLDEFMAGSWGNADTRGFIRDRFGVSEDQVDSVLGMLAQVSQGNILDALRSAPRNTTFAYTLASVVAGSLSNAEMHVPLMTMQVDSSVNLYNSEVLFINAIAFAELVLSQKYTIQATQREDQRWNLEFIPNGELDPLGGVGAGGEIGFYAGNESRYVSLSVVGEWDAEIQEVVGTATLKFTDASGNPFGIPMDGRLYTAMLASVDTEGRLRASGTLELSVVENDDYALMVSFGAAYGTNIADASQQWLARIGTRDYWTLMPGATFEIRNIGEIDTGLEKISAGVHGIFDATGAQAGVMGNVMFYGGDWSVGVEAGWRRIQVLPDMGDLIIGEDQTIDTGQFGIRMEF